MLAITLICKAYDFKLGSKWLTGKVNSICNRIDVNTLEQNPAPALELNEICIVEILLNQPACFDGYKDNRATGSLVFIDRLSNVTVSAGMTDCEQQPRTRFEPPQCSRHQGRTGRPLRAETDHRHVHRRLRVR